MPQRTEDLTGRRFGRLTVLERDRTPRPDGNRRAYWLCACDCGTKASASGYALRSGTTRSCGCLRLRVPVDEVAETRAAVRHGTRRRTRNPEKAHEHRRRWRDAHQKERQALLLRNRKKVNDKLRETAERHGQEWTGVELEIASRPDLTARQVAEVLHRTLNAVRTMRQRLNSDLDPRDRMLANGPQPPTSRSGPR
jgi:hypothetical protein